MSQPDQRITLPSGFVFDGAAAATHVMQPPHTRGVTSSRGLEEGTTGSRRGKRPLASRSPSTPMASSPPYERCPRQQHRRLRDGAPPTRPAHRLRPGRLGQGACRRVGVLGAGRSDAHRELQQAHHRYRHDAHPRREQPPAVDEDHRLPARLLA